MLRSKSPSKLQKEVSEVQELSPQSAKLPMQDALRAYGLIADEIVKMTFTLLDAPTEDYYVLGDTPTPQYQMNHGFTLPLSKATALQAIPSQGSTTNRITRRAASSTEVQDINREQWENAAKTVIGPDPVVLRKLIS
jgi:hypothetical protein